MQLKEKIINLLNATKNDELLAEIYSILQESEKDIQLTESQLKRIDLAENQIKYGKVKSHEEVMKKYSPGE